MAVINKILNGKLNYDSSLHMLPPGDFIQALNITRDQLVGGKDFIVSNVIGNRLVINPFMPEGRNKCIGCKADPVRNVVYFLNWNEGGEHCVFRYNNATRNIDLILQEPPPPETPPTPPATFNFEENKKIIHIDIVHRDEGDLISWSVNNDRPIMFNVNTAITGGFLPLNEFVEAAKRPPLFPVYATYISDANVKTNTLKGKLFQFAYRYVYSDFQKSTFSVLSQSPLPNNDYIANLNPLSNNGIELNVFVGNANVKKVEVAMRYNIGNVYSDYYLINVIDKEQLGIGNSFLYVFSFYNNAVYPAIDSNQSNQLFDWLPKRANAQCMPNGNYMTYGGITEGYHNMTLEELDVLMEVSYETVVLPTGTIVIGNPTFSFVRNSLSSYTCTIGSTVTAGDVYTLVGQQAFSSQFTIQYTAILGDTPDDVANYFVTEINALPFSSFVSASDSGGGVFDVTFLPPSGTLTTSALPATAPGGGGFYDRIYKFGAKYRFGIVYFDDQGRTPGVQTYVEDTGSLNDFEVEIDEFNAFDTAYKRPVISMTIQHLPPQWARSYSIVRTEDLIAGPYFFWKGDAFDDAGGYYYIGIDNLEAYQTANPNWTAAWTFQAGDRLKGQYQFNGANDTGWGAIYSPVLDFEVIGTVEYDFGTGDQTAIKVRAYSGTISPDPYDDRLVFQVYRPAQKTTSSQQVYYEFGETYETVEIDGVWYHLGQTASSDPTLDFTDGDSYIRIRPGTGDEYLILDPNFSEYEPSALDSNGRAFIVDDNAAELYNPTLVRFSEAFQPNTNINNLNRFYFENFDEYNRAYGDILKLDTFESYMKVGQQLRIGNVPVFNQIIKTQTGSDAVTTSDILLNQIYYYTGDFGVGNSPESWARNNFACYFTDSIRGVVCRLSLDGITPLSILYGTNSWATAKLPLRTGNSKIYGVFDAAVNRYEIALEAAGSDLAFTMVFDEPTNSFEGERSYQPEMWCCLGTLKISFKDGQLYTHDSTTYNNFYGVQYESSVTAVFNENAIQKETFMGITEVSNTIWDCPEIYTNIQSISQLNLPQQSNLITQDFELIEGNYVAPFRCDINSPGGILNGDSLKGLYVAVKFRAQVSQTSNLVYLALSQIRFTDSQLNVIN